MPSGRTHDLITVALAPPTFAAALVLTGSIALAAIVTVFMLFGGLMFGPDLDTLSRQYSRWGWFRVLWYPYRVVFRHRSRWSHGLTVGTLVRVLYFSGVIALVVSLGIYLRAVLLTGGAPSAGELGAAWRVLGQYLTETIGAHAVWAMLAGLWWGAASHTLADVFWSVLRKGSQIF